MAVVPAWRAAGRCSGRRHGGAPLLPADGDAEGRVLSRCRLVLRGCVAIKSLKLLETWPLARGNVGLCRKKSDSVGFSRRGTVGGGPPWRPSLQIPPPRCPSTPASPSTPRARQPRGPAAVGGAPTATGAAVRVWPAWGGRPAALRDRPRGRNRARPRPNAQTANRVQLRSLALTWNKVPVHAPA